MRKYFNYLLIIFCTYCSIGFGQCINTTAYGSATVNACSSGTISTCNYASEYGEITFNTVGTYTFNSSVATDYLTLTTSANVVIASGSAPLVASIPSNGGYRLHVSTNSSCGTQNACRVTTYACATATLSTGCINTTAYGTATINACSNGTISTCNYASEYSELTFNTVGTYTFNSSVATDFLTLTTSANAVITSGSAPLVASIPSNGGYRLHVSTNSSCGTQNVCRVTTYACGSATTTGGCISTSPYGSATITACSPGTITTCNWGGEYSQLDIGVTGFFTFYSSNTTDYLTLTDAANNILFFGTTPLLTNIATIGNYRLHISANSACATDNVCRTTSYDCINVPCSGTPNAGATTVSSNTICGAQNISCGLVGSTIALGLSYQWQSSPNNTTWTSIPSFTNSTMTQLVNSNTYFRCILSCGSFSANSISSFVSVGGTPIGGSAISSAPNSCAGTLINFSLSGNSNWAGLNYQWQSSPNNVTWSNIAGSTSAAFAQLVNTTTYYRCILSCISSTIASASVLVTSASPLIYANIPYYETFDNIWQNGCAIRNVPNNLYWKSSPLTGDNAWRQQNDGVSASWTSASVANVSPQSGAGCANFHSTQATENTKGDLDVLVNFNQNAKYAISFYYINTSGTDYLNVLLSSDGGVSYSVKGYYPTQANWAKKTIYYNAVNTPSCVIKFKGNADNGISDLGIDSLAVRLICLNPNITASSTSDSLCSGQTATLTASGATSYTWSPIGSISNTVIVSPSLSTNYVLIGSNDGVCFPSTNVSIWVAPCAIGIEELYNDQANIYPNPTTGILNIEFKAVFNYPIFILSNAIGEIIIEKALNNKVSEVNIEELPCGIYFYKIANNATTIKVGKLVKQ